MPQQPLIQVQDTSFGMFFDLLTGYRVSLVMLLLRRSRIIEIVAPTGCAEDELLDALPWDRTGAQRFVRVLVEMGLLQRDDKYLFASPFSRKFLWSQSGAAQLQTLTFEEHLLQNWLRLEDAIERGTRIPARDKSPEEYGRHLRLFLDAMDEAARHRSRELWSCIDVPQSGMLVEIGAGSGAYIASFLEQHPGWSARFVDLPDVIAAASERLQKLADQITCIPWNYLDEPMPDGLMQGASAVLVSNVLHCQGPDATFRLLDRIRDAIPANAVLVLHDFFNDAGWRGALYDFHMLVNTPEGRTYSIAEMTGYLKANGFAFTIRDLPSFSTAILASRTGEILPQPNPAAVVIQEALRLGFDRAIVFDAGQIPVEEWVVEKCRTGCRNYGRTASCPPRSRTPDETRRLLAGYQSAILLLGQPPLKQLQQRLLDLEYFAAANGHRKALALGSGHCSLCDECRPDDCRFPARRRFSLEACGCDVYGLCNNLGVELAPVTKDLEYVQYVAALLLE